MNINTRARHFGTEIQRHETLSWVISLITHDMESSWVGAVMAASYFRRSLQLASFGVNHYKIALPLEWGMPPHPEPYTPHPTPHTHAPHPHPTSHTPNPPPHTSSPSLSTANPQPSTLNPLPSRANQQASGRGGVRGTRQRPAPFTLQGYLAHKKQPPPQTL